MAAMTGLALVGAVPMTAEEHERSRLVPFVHQLLNSEVVRRVIAHWAPPPPPPPQTADAATSVTEEELAAAAAGGRTGPPPDLVACHQEPPLMTDFRGSSAREPTARQLRLRLDRLQAVRRAVRREPPPAGPDGGLSLPPPGPDWRSSRHLRLHDQHSSEDADDEDSGPEGEEAAGRSSVGRELGAVADRLDASHSPGTQTRPAQKESDGASPAPGLAGELASKAVTACGLAALGFLVRQLSLADD